MLKKSVILLPFFLGLFIYSPVFLYGYVWDDHYFFGDSDFFSRAEFSKHFLSSLPLWKDNVFYRPLTQVLFGVQYASGNGNASFFHVLSFLNFMGNAALVMGIVYRVLPEESGREGFSGSRWFWAGVAGSVFVVHPVMVESVSWISSQFDLQMTFWVLLLIYVGTYQKKAWKSFLLSSFLFFCASASKEGAVSLLPVFLVFHYLISVLPEANFRSFSLWISGRKWLPDALGIVVGGGIYWVLRTVLLDGGVANMFRSDIVDIVLNALRASFWYLRISLLPFYGVGMHFVEGKEYFTTAYATAGFLSLLAIGALLRIYLALGLILLSFLMALSPALLTTGAGYSSTFISDRYLSYPLAILIVQLCVLVGSIAPAIKVSNFFAAIVKGLAVVLLLFMAFYSSILVRAWQSDLSLWVFALEANPDSSYARGQVVGHYAMNGYCEKATEIAAQRPTSTVAAAVGLIAQCQLKKNPEAAIRDLNAILQRPGELNELDLYSILSALALAHVSLQQYEQAVEIYRDLVEAYPLRYKLHMSLSAALLLACKPEDAEQEYRIGMNSVPEYARKSWQEFHDNTAAQAFKACGRNE